MPGQKPPSVGNGHKEYRILTNWRFAGQGLLEVYRSETGFRYLLWAIAVASLALPFLALPLTVKWLLFFSLGLPVVAELFNSAVERVVDLCTDDHHHLAMQAKDAAAAGAVGSILLVIAFWLVMLGLYWGQVAA